MSNAPKPRRFVVSDLGFTYAVHDTQAEQEYAFRSANEITGLSSNKLNSVRVALFATREEAVRDAMHRNEAV